LSESLVLNLGRILELTILMPCLNESETLGICINGAKSWISREGISAEILVADNGSTDGSQKIALELGARVIDAPNPGYGAALYAGVIGARGKYIIMGDSDDSYNFSELTPFLRELRRGSDLVIGNRFAPPRKGG
jgi:glycosyltransferase involved in cell wall biosynthesis